MKFSFKSIIRISWNIVAIKTATGGITKFSAKNLPERAEAKKAIIGFIIVKLPINSPRKISCIIPAVNAAAAEDLYPFIKDLRIIKMSKKSGIYFKDGKKVLTDSWQSSKNNIDKKL